MAAGFGGHAGFGSFSSGASPGASSSGTAQGYQRRQPVLGSGDPISVESISTRAGDENLLEDILNGDKEPTDLPLELLRDITDNFSEERKIGQGGFGAVYKGVVGTSIVAVKRIDVNVYTVDDKSFRREVTSLMKINHDNVVRFLGFCSNTQCKSIKDPGSGENVLVNVNERLLCLEYIHNGSLDRHITDELRGLEWETRYEIITGICKGLHYLHMEKDIIHMDLKPANILLAGEYMVPKITDFGLSRPNKNSHTVGLCFGTLGYLAPEYLEDSKTTPACDIYSLGVIILELVTGFKDMPDKKNVLRRWKHRWSKPPTLLQYQQVTRCIEIAVRCRAKRPEARPSMLEIISLLSVSESTDGNTSQESNYLDDDMLGIEPLELHFTFQLNMEMSWLVKLTNKTKACFAFNIKRPSKQYTIQPDKGIVPPECKEYLVQITLQPQERAPQVSKNADKFVVLSRRVSSGQRVEDINEHIFHEEAGKVVDEVNLMVVYESTKLGSSGKAKAASLDVNSSARGQCVTQTGQYNLHPLQSFSRHYRTNKKYLVKESERAVDLARGAMGSLLDKLGKLVTEDYNLKTSIKGDIESFSEDLKIIHQHLPKLESVDEAKIWVDEVRELSYHIEDMVDSFLVHVEPDSDGTGFRELTHEGLKLLVNGKPTHSNIEAVIKDIKNQVLAVAGRKEKYKFNANNVAANATAEVSIDPRISGIYIDREHLIGIEEQINEIIRLFEEDVDVSKLKIVSVVGSGGLGKTTLAKAVYDKLAVHDKLKVYHHKAFVPVGQNPILKAVLKKIIIGCRSQKYNAARLEYLDEQQLIGELQNFLKDKRYFIVIDDLWDSVLWDTINSAFPRDNCGSRVLTTTRIQEVVDRDRWNVLNKVYKIKPLSYEDSRTLFFTRTFGPGKDCPPRKEEISEDILKRCGGMPLAINSIARHLARDATDSTWEYVRKSLGAIKGNDIEMMKQILDLSYIHLPGHLKTCLLHICMYPEDWEIDKNDLLRQWVAEGFVITDGDHNAEDVAEEYFRALIDRFMIEPGKRDYYNNEVLSCKVHDIILDLMRSKSSEVNFSHVIDGSKDETGAHGMIRRVSVHSNDKKDNKIFETMKNKDLLKHVRSVILYRDSLVPYVLEFKYVRVLHIDIIAFSSNCLDLTGINRLFQLRYLKFVNNVFQKKKGKFVSTGARVKILKLPDQIGELQQLETIDLHNCVVRDYPSSIITLPRLSHLIYDTGDIGVGLPDGISRLKSLRTLVGVCLFGGSVNAIKGLGEMTNLRNLEICSLFYGRSTEQIDARMDELWSSIARLHTSLRILTMKLDIMAGSKRVDLSGWSRTLFPQGSHIQKLDLSGHCFPRCPKWIGQLNDLYSFRIQVSEVADGLSIVAGLPSLAYFCLYIKNCPEEKEESALFPGSGSFRSLKHLRFRCKKASLTFEEGALPKLEKLEILFRHHMTRRFLPVGIEHLPAGTLKEINLSVAQKKETTPTTPDWDMHRAKILKHEKYKTKLRLVLERAFKVHHPRANIVIHFDEGDIDEEFEDIFVAQGVDDDEDYEEDDEGVDDEEDHHTVQVRLIEAPLCSSPDRGEPMAKVPVDINDDLLLQQGNNGVLVNTVGQYIDLNQAPPGGLLDISEAPNELNGEEFLELNEDVEPRSISCSSCIHAAANLCFIFLLRIQVTCSSCLRS